nr:DUF4124 domain-containing protein [Pelobacter propionicus]
MLEKSAQNLLLSSLLVFISFYGTACADIYRYDDSDGSVHFTDAPTDKRFKIFMRDQ